MPDDAREIVFPDGVPVRQISGQDQSAQEQSGQKESENSQSGSSLPSVPSSSSVTSPSPVPSAAKPEKVVVPAAIDHSEDVSSENDDIRRQAEQARDPEDGSNIL